MLAGGVVILLLLVGFLYWSDQPGFRYGFVGNAQQCSVQQMAELPTNVEFVALGSSRVRRGIDADFAAATSDGEISVSFNLGRAGRNVMRTYTMFADVVERSPNLKYAYIEMDLEPLLSGRGNRLGARADIAIMRYRDILLLYDANADASMIRRFHIVAQAMFRKVSSSVSHFLSGDAFSYAPRRDEAVETVCWSPSYDRVSRGDRREKQQQRKAMQKQYGNFHTALSDADPDMRSPRARGELYFLDRIRELAAAHEVQLVVSRHWVVYEPPFSEATVARLQEIIPEFVYPSAGFVRKSWDDFIDANHLGKRARRDFTSWMLGELLAGGGAQANAGARR
jgi:hypothetical protein